MLVALATVLSGCPEAGTGVADRCRIEPGSEDERVGAAGCLVQRGDSILAVRDRDSGRWGFPAGNPRAKENAQCTAARETFEESGVEVTVGSLAARLGSSFFLYRCTLLDSNSEPATRPGPEILAVDWLNLQRLSPAAWRYPGQVTRIRALAAKGKTAD